MPSAPNGNEIFIGSGRLYFERFDSNGNSTGRRFLGNASKFEINPSVETEDVWNMTSRIRSKLAHITKTQDHTVSFDLDEYQPKNLNMALLGNDAFYTQTGGALTGEVIASSTPSATVPSIPTGITVLKLANRNVSLVTIKATTASTPTTLTQGTDWEIDDAVTGLIRILTVANFPGGITGLTADYTAAAMTSTAAKTVINAGSSPQFLGGLYLVGDPVSGRGYDVDVWRAQFAPSSALGFISDSHATMSFSGSVLVDALNHPQYPFYRVVER